MLSVNMTGVEFNIFCYTFRVLIPGRFEGLDSTMYTVQSNSTMQSHTYIHTNIHTYIHTYNVLFREEMAASMLGA